MSPWLESHSHHPDDGALLVHRARGQRLVDFRQLRDPYVTMASWPRTLPAAVSAALEWLAIEDIEPVRFVAPAEHVHELVRARLDEALRADVSLKRWLARDIGLLARSIAAVTQAESVRVRLDRTESRMCPRFHADHVSYRLLCTYRGRGTEWCAPENAERSIRRDAGIPDEDCRVIPTGTVAAFRGRLHAHPASKPLWHRSPDVAEGDLRIVLCIDPLAEAELH